MSVRALPMAFFMAAVASTPAASQTAPSNTQAVTILQQALSAAGGAVGHGSIQDFAASGTITYFWAGEQVQGPATVKGRGPDQFRIDANLPEGTRTYVLNHGAGQLKDAAETLSSIPLHNTVNLGILTFPYPSIAMVLSDPLTTVSNLGLVSVDGSNFFRSASNAIFRRPKMPTGRSGVSASRVIS